MIETEFYRKVKKLLGIDNIGQEGYATPYRAMRKLRGSSVSLNYYSLELLGVGEAISLYASPREEYFHYYPIYNKGNELLTIRIL